MEKKSISMTLLVTKTLHKLRNAKVPHRHGVTRTASCAGRRRRRRLKSAGTRRLGKTIVHFRFVVRETVGTALCDPIEGPRLGRMCAGRGLNLYLAFDFLDQNQRWLARGC